MFDQNKFNSFVIDHGVLGFFEQPITLVSGRESSWYFNWRSITSDVFLTDKLADFLIDFVADKGIDFDCLYGTPDGATKLAVISQYKWALQQANYAEDSHPLPMGRKKPKDHGAQKDRYFVGAPMGKIIVLEDVTTTGGSLLDTVKQLLEMKYEVVAAVALTNRNALLDNGRHVSEMLKDLNVNYYAMGQALELLPLIIQRQKVSKEIRESVIDEFKQYGEREIEL